MQFLRLNEICRMICYSILLNNVNLVEIGCEWLLRKTTVLCVLMRISLTKSTFSLGKNLVALDTYAKKMNPPSIVLGGGGVYGKVCWLIAYNGTRCGMASGHATPITGEIFKLSCFSVYLDLIELYSLKKLRLQFLYKKVMVVAAHFLSGIIGY